MKGACARVAKGIALLSFWLPCLLNSQPIRYQLLPLSFLPGSASLSPSDTPILDSLASFLQKTGARVEIGGHTDNLGTPNQNEELSRLRAQAVSDYLQTKHKIPLSQLTVRGYGPSQPVATNRTPAGRAKNNRIEITVLSNIASAIMSRQQGTVRVRKPGMTDWNEVLTEQRITIADVIETDSAGRALIMFDEGAKIQLFPRTVVLCTEINSQVIQLWAESGSLHIDNYASVENTNRLTISSHDHKVISRSGDGFLIVRPNELDALSVWRGAMTVEDLRSGQTVEVKAGYGVQGIAGLPLESPMVLPSTPVIHSISGQDTLWLESGEPLKFTLYITKPDTITSWIMLSRDKERQDIIAEIMSNDDSLFFSGSRADAVYASVCGVSANHLISPWTASRLIGVARKTTGPKLIITRQSFEIQDHKAILRLEGKTEPLSRLAVNQENIRIPDDGSFSMMIKLKPGTNRISLTATNRWGHATKRIISLTPNLKHQLEIFAGPSYLSGSGYNTSRIGLSYGGAIKLRMSNKLYLGASGISGKIGCRTTVWEPEGDRYQTNFLLGGFGLAYHINPEARFVYHAGTEAGLIYWKSFYNEELYEWAINPYVGLNGGVMMVISGRCSFLLSAGAGYLRNKEKYNLGAQGIKYLLLAGRFGVVFSF